MKKLILQILAVCAVGILFPAAAQNSANQVPDAGGSPPAQGADGSPPPDMSAPQPDQGTIPQQPDQGAVVPPDQSTVPQPDPGAPVQPAPALPQGGVRPSIRFIRPAASAQTAVNPNTGLPEAGNLSQSPSLQIQTPSDSPVESEPANLRLNFNNVQLEQVLSYLSDAAGFIIVMDTQVRGTVSVISKTPMTRDEAVDLLNSVLNQNGYAAIRNGRTLTIVSKDDAKTRDIPVNTYNGNPASIPKNDEIVTQIIPVRFVDASQLVSDLSSFVSPQATVVANQAGNSIIVTDTQENIRHLVEIISAIDSSAAGETEIQVFPLAFANPNDVATELGQVFPSGSSGTGLSPIAFRGGPGGGFGGGFGGGGGGFFARAAAAAAAANNNGGNRAQKQSQVTAVADPRTQSVIVMASKDLMNEISGMIHELDVASARDQQVHVVHLDNADPAQVLQVLQGTFPSGPVSSSSSSATSTQSDARYQREQQGATAAGQSYQSMSGSSGGSGLGRVGGGAGGGLP